jgi:hypothetical protein
MTDLTEPTQLTTRTPRRGGAAGLVVVAWCVAVAVAATAGWLVVDKVGSSLLGSSGPGLSGVPTGASTSSSSPTSGSGAGSLSTAGGRVTAICTSPQAIKLQSAVPTTNWRYEVNATGPRALNVEFRSGSRKVEVDGVCRAGVPVLTQGHGGSSSSSGPGASSSSSSDDHGGGRGGGSSGSSSGGSDDSGGSGSGKHGSGGGSSGSGGSNDG